MNRSREDLHEVLVGILGSRNVYYQPPESLTLKYPCIIYKKTKVDKVHANNDAYLKKNRYTITVIDKSPVSSISDKVLSLRTCSFDRTFTNDNLNHFVYNLYY